MRKKRKSDGVGRLSISLPKGLMKDLDRMVVEKGYANRSLMIGDMTRDWLVEHRAQYGDQELAGTITLVYDHHRSRVQAVLTDVQHDRHHAVISTLHVHLDHDNCLEVIVVRGKAAAIKKLADALVATRGVKHGKLILTSTGKDLVG